MTYERDKLPALAGLATTYSQSTQDDYLAGLWRQSLIVDLQWRHQRYVYGNEATMRVPSKYRAPSWFWASVDGNIRYYSPSNHTPMTEVLGTYADAPDAKFSHVKGSEWLSLCGPLLEASIEKRRLVFLQGGSASILMDRRTPDQILMSQSDDYSFSDHYAFAHDMSNIGVWSLTFVWTGQPV